MTTACSWLKHSLLSTCCCTQVKLCGALLLRCAFLLGVGFQRPFVTIAFFVYWFFIRAIFGLCDAIAVDSMDDPDEDAWELLRRAEEEEQERGMGSVERDKKISISESMREGHDQGLTPMMQTKVTTNEKHGNASVA